MIFGRQFYSLVLIFTLGFLSSYGQTLENVKTSFDGERMVITYDLNHTDASQKFKVTLYSSHDNYRSPLSSITGDLGENVTPGKAKRVVWDAKSSLSADFDADVSVKIKAAKVVAAVAPLVPLVFKPLDVGVYKRGRTVELRWVGGSPNDKLNVELYRNNVAQLRIAEKIDNTQSFTWKMPKGQKAGKDYLVRIYNAGKPTELANSQVFNIKPRVPLLLKIAPVIVVGGAVAFLGGPKNSKEVVNEDLPGPVKPN